MREIALDTETTGIDCAGGDRVVEIGCVELMNHVPTGATYQTYINPEREMPEGAFRVHGLSAEFLSGHAVFADVVDGFLEFIGGATLVIHNAEFDLGFLNAELARLDRPLLDAGRAVDTIQLARQKFPGGRYSLDALCARFQIDNSDRDLHGALKDAQLLAQVYLELTGGRQHGLALGAEGGAAGPAPGGQAAGGDIRPPRPHRPTNAEEAEHARFLDTLKEPLWRT